MATFTATVDNGYFPPRVLLQLTGAAGASVTVTRNVSGSSTRAVRSANPAGLESGSWSDYDYEPPYASLSDTAVWAGGTATTGVVLFGPGRSWLRHPGVPSLSMPVEVQAEEDLTYGTTRARFDPIGRRYPIIVSDGVRHSRSSTLTIRTDTLNEAADLQALLDDSSVLLLSVPPEWGWGITNHYLSLGDVSVRRATPTYAPDQTRYWSMPYDEVDQPAGGVQALWTAGQVDGLYTTWTDLMAAYPTNEDLLLNRVGGA